MKIYLDDERVPEDTFNTQRISDPIYLEKDWVIVRNYFEFVDIINTKGIPYLVSFDHDLADEHYIDFMKCGGKDLGYEDYKEKTGFEAAKFLVNKCMNEDLDFPAWKVHSHNFIGAKNIGSYIRSFIKSRKK